MTSYMLYNSLGADAPLVTETRERLEKFAESFNAKMIGAGILDSHVTLFYTQKKTPSAKPYAEFSLGWGSYLFKGKITPGLVTREGIKITLDKDLILPDSISLKPGSTLSLGDALGQLGSYTQRKALGKE